MSIENAELWEAMKSAKYRDTLGELERLVNSAKSLDEVLGIMINSIVEAVHAEAGTLWYYDYYGTGKIIPRASYGGKEIDSFRLELGEGIAGGVIKDAKPVMIADCSKDPRWAGKVDAKTGFLTRSLICVPLIASESSIAFGSVQIINKADGSLFDEADFEFATSLAGEFSRLYMERFEGNIVGNVISIKYGFDDAFSEDTIDKAVNKIQSSLEKYNFDENTIKKIDKHFVKIYDLLNKSK